MVIDCKHVWERIHDFLQGALDGELLVAVQHERVYPLPLGFSERLHARLDQELSGSDRL